MPSLKEALRLIKTFEGFNEKAFTDPTTGEEDFIIGYGTTYYPDGSQVRQGHLCTEQKAEEYLKNETDLIASEILKLNLGLDACMLNALVSFVHSVGWESFLYSSIIDCCEQEDYVGRSK
jgi:lysozyme